MVWPHLKIPGHCEDSSEREQLKEHERGTQKKRWEDSIKERTGMGIGDSLRAAEYREMWKSIVATSFGPDDLQG